MRHQFEPISREDGAYEKRDAPSYEVRRVQQKRSAAPGSRHPESHRPGYGAGPRSPLDAAMYPYGMLVAARQGFYFLSAPSSYYQMELPCWKHPELPSGSPQLYANLTRALCKRHPGSWDRSVPVRKCLSFLSFQLPHKGTYLVATCVVHDVAELFSKHHIDPTNILL